MLTLKERELVLKWDKQGKGQQLIAELLGCNQSSISRLIAKYHRHGLVENLKRSGRPTILTKINLENIREKITREVKAANEKYCSLNPKQMSSIIKKEVGKEYSGRHIERIMHKIGFSRITPRPKHIKNDPVKVNEFSETKSTALRKLLYKGVEDYVIELHRW